MDKLNNNHQEKNHNHNSKAPLDSSVTRLLARAGEAGGDRLEFSRSRQVRKTKIFLKNEIFFSSS